jgi:hypothetical protein
MMKNATSASKIKKKKKKGSKIDEKEFDDNSRNVRNLLEHERNSLVKIKKTQDGKGEYMMFKQKDSEQWTKVDGLLPHLSRVFYWNYNYNDALKMNIPIGTAEGCYDPVTADGDMEWSDKKKRKRSDSAEKCDSKKQKVGMYENMKKKKHEGAERGKKLDTELYWYINSKTKTGKNSMFQKMVKNPSSEFQDMLKARKAWKWTPIRAQFPIYIEALKIGTKIDEVDITENNELVIIDNKLGFKKYLTKGNGMMKGPLSDVSNCPLNQQFLQVAMERIILEELWGVKVAKAYVIQGVPEGVYPHKLPEWTVKRKYDIWNYFIENCLRE